MRTRSATRGLHHRALVRVREVDLLRLGVAAEALHLHDLALPGEALLADDRADEDQDDRDAEEDAGEVERRAHEGPDDQQDENGDCDLHRRGSKSRNRSVPRGKRLAGLARTTRTSDCGGCRWSRYSSSRLPRSTSSRVSNVSSFSSPAPSITGRV